ncbi:MAG: hypothetical protein HDR51_08215 [Treponema sp.]|nr:hypothetical protein [Treponema sp.]MBD5408221.1 hypothetical protein [Treponema sp.]MBD5412710.1 hypothetical protein [Treponema sp.]
MVARIVETGEIGRKVHIFLLSIPQLPVADEVCDVRQANGATSRPNIKM